MSLTVEFKYRPGDLVWFVSGEEVISTRVMQCLWGERGVSGALGKHYQTASRDITYPEELLWDSKEAAARDFYTRMVEEGHE